jgi:hypothetical protein
MSREGEMAAAAYLANSLSSSAEKEAHYAEVRRLRKEIAELYIDRARDYSLRRAIQFALERISPDHPIFEDQLWDQANSIGAQISKIDNWTWNDIDRAVMRFFDLHKTYWPGTEDIANGTYQPTTPPKFLKRVEERRLLNKITVNETPSGGLFNIFRSEESIKARAKEEIESRKKTERDRRKHIEKVLGGDKFAKFDPMPITPGLTRKPSEPNSEKDFYSYSGAPVAPPVIEPPREPSAFASFTKKYK